MIYTYYYYEGMKLVKCDQMCNKAAGEDAVEEELIRVENIGYLGRPALVLLWKWCTAMTSIGGLGGRLGCKILFLNMKWHLLGIPVIPLRKW